MKKITLKIITLAAALSCGSSAMAADFGLAGLSMADVVASQAEIKAPAPRVDTGDDDLIGIDMAVRIPFKALKKAVGQMAASEKRLTIIDQAAPVVSKAGEFMKISNISVDAGGIIVLPTITLKPYMEGRDKLAIRIQRIALHASMEPSVKSAPAPAIDEEQIMQQVMDVMIKGVYSALDAKLKAKQIPMKAQDIITLKYDKAAWLLHAKLSSKVLHEFLPEGLVGDLHLTGFALTETGITMNIQTAQ